MACKVPTSSSSLVYDKMSKPRKTKQAAKNNTPNDTPILIPSSPPPPLSAHALSVPLPSAKDIRALNEEISHVERLLDEKWTECLGKWKDVHELQDFIRIAPSVRSVATEQSLWAGGMTGIIKGKQPGQIAGLNVLNAIVGTTPL
jgi:hypothetical protein